MSWMEALNAMAEHARRTSNTFFVFVNKTYSGRYHRHIHLSRLTTLQVFRRRRGDRFAECQQRRADLHF